MPILQVGGVHEAVTLTPPVWVVEVVIPPAVLTFPIEKFEELQVRGTPVMILPRVSVTIASTDLEVPAVAEKLVVLPPAIESEIEFTGQLMKLMGSALTLAALA